MGRVAKLDPLLTLVKALSESAQGLTHDEIAQEIGATMNFDAFTPKLPAQPRMSTGETLAAMAQFSGSRA